MRVSGLASGMEIDSIVKELMAAKRAPLNKLNQQKQVMQWTRDSYRDINSKVVDFRNKLSNFRISTAMNGMKSTVTGNTSALTAIANSEANQIPMDIIVNKLASNEQLTTNATLKDITSKSTLKEVAAVSGFTAFPDGDGKNIYKMIINDQTFSFDESTSVSQVVSTINANTKVNVTATFDQVKGKLILTSKKFEDPIIVTSPGAEENGLLNLFGGSTTEDAHKAEISVNGIDKEFDSNKFILNGVSINLLSTTEDGKASKISTVVDSTKMLETITSFVNDFNDLLGMLNTKKSEAKYRDFQPLTDDQKKGMKDDDIENWQNKAKSGLLKNDSILSSAASVMRESIFSGMAGIGGIKLSSIGIDTGQYFEGGKLYIKDPEKLKKAIEDNPQGVMDLFQINSPDQTAPKGIFVQMYNSLDGVLSTISSKAGTSKYSTDVNATYKEESVMGKQLKQLTKRMTELTSRLTKMETSYYRQFSAMESAMNKYNAQSTTLSNFIAK